MSSKKIVFTICVTFSIYVFFSTSFYLSRAYAYSPSPSSPLKEAKLKRMIARMIIIGFDKEDLTPSDPFVEEIKTYCPGGVILFDHDFYHRDRIKNIRSPEQLKKLTKELRRYAPRPILIGVDQEGGMVMRLKPQYGFINIPSAQAIGEMNNTSEAKKIYLSLAKELRQMGINCDFAPVVDLAINPKNFVIVGLHRSYGKSPQKVITYARIFCRALHSQGIISVLKHFPGHGSSTGDSHKGFVDITKTWSPIELKPYKVLIKEKVADMIMTAHVFNKRLDPDYPATLSKKINTGLLRKKLKFKGVIVSDDLQMKAISACYSLPQTVTLAINAGIDMLLFGNQLAKISLSKVVDIIYAEVKKGNISPYRIKEANLRINQLFKRYKLGNIAMHYSTSQ